MTAGHEVGICSVCGRGVRLGRTGKIGPHGPEWSYTPKLCDGYGKPPGPPVDDGVLKGRL